MSRGAVIDRSEILIIEHSNALSTPITQALEEAGLKVVGVTDGIEGPYTVYKSHPDLLIIVEDLPSIIVQKLCLRIRQISSIPIIVLSPSQEVSNLANVLEAGADAYMARFSSIAELIARVRSMLRRSKEWGCSSYIADLSRGFVNLMANQWNGTNNFLPTGYPPASTLIIEEDKLMPYQEALSNFWGEKQDSSDSLEFCTSCLRQKFSRITTISATWLIGERPGAISAGNRGENN